MKKDLLMFVEKPSTRTPPSIPARSSLEFLWNSRTPGWCDARSHPVGRRFELLEELKDGGRGIPEYIPLLVHTRLNEAEGLLCIDGGKHIHQRIGLCVADERVLDILVGQIQIGGAAPFVVLQVVSGDDHPASGSGSGLHATGSTPRSGSPTRQ